MPRISEGRIYDFIGSIYDRAREKSPVRWQNVFNDFASMISSGPGGLSLYCETANQFNIVAGTTQPEFLKSYSEYYQYVSPLNYEVRRMQTGERLSRIERCPNDEFESSEIYQDFFRKQDVFEFEYHLLFKHAGLNAGLSFSRPRSNPYFTPNERNAISVIVPHLHRAFLLYLELVDAKRENLAMADALGKIPRSVIVVDRSRRVIFANSHAESQLALKDGIQIDSNGILNASRASDSKKLSAVVNSVFETSLDIGATETGLLQLPKPSGGRSLQVLVSPFAEKEMSKVEGEPLAIVFVHDPDDRTHTVEQILCQTYGLTSAEAHLTAILADGKSLNETCEILAITQNTARTHLKRVFSKTYSNRQTELVKLVIRSNASLIPSRKNTAA